MNFKDHFSQHSSIYTKYRPHYPEELFTHVSSLTATRHKAWDCATGNGQAAWGLVPHFDHVIATDASEQQITHAIAHEKIAYIIAPAEKTHIESHSIDLVTIAQALHWFNFEQFYTEVKRILKPGGVVAAWSYGLFTISPKLDNLLNHFYTDIVGHFWPPEREFVEEKYQTIPFPFQELPAPSFMIETSWSLPHLIGYLNTWSAVQRFKREKNTDPVEYILDALHHEWGSPDSEKKIYWPLHIRIGRV